MGLMKTHDHHAAKHDQGKPITGCILDFSHALQAVAAVSTFGANKYARGSWRTVPNARERYLDAAMRHLLAHHAGETLDTESGLPHLHHALWNWLAVAELDLRKTP